MQRSLLLISWFALMIPAVFGEERETNVTINHSGLPGHIDEPIGSVNSIEMPLQDGPECRKYRISVPENRAADSSRNIRLYFYRFKARKPSGRAPIFFLPGGPGGFYNDDWVKGLNKKPEGGSNLEAWLYAQNRDVVLVNQRGARLPDKTYQFLFFISFGTSLAKPFDYESAATPLKENAKIAIDQWTSRGMDLAGYDIMNMIEDINDIRVKLGYERIALRGTSFGSQWSMAYMQKYPQHVDRAVLGGTEPIDHGWDSPQGMWNVIGRLEELLNASPSRSKLGFPDVPLTEAIKTIVKRLEKKPVVAEISSQKIPIGVQDFQRCLLGGIGGHREQLQSFANMPKFIYEVYNENYDFLAAQVRKQRPSTSPVPLQFLLIDNSLGISKDREEKLDHEPGRRWIGELNSIYKATRNVTPTPVIGDAFRELRTDIPMLLVHGDFDLSTPIENAEELLSLSKNAHLIRITGGTHGAFDQIADHDAEFLSVIARFLDANLESGDQTFKSLGLPTELNLPPLQFRGIQTR
jgi:pimeloyl-ACP methyl ester carboxylesterase